MKILLVVMVALLVLMGVVAVLKGAGTEEGESVIQKKKYAYKKKQFFLTRAEHEFYDVLVQAVGKEYLIFAQVHLASLLDHKVKGQLWKAAFSHINGKSVDFVLCDKAYISPKLAIELDDKSHEEDDRQVRDREVERVLQGAGLPLLRIENHGSFNPHTIAAQIQEALK